MQKAKGKKENFPSYAGGRVKIERKGGRERGSFTFLQRRKKKKGPLRRKIKEKKKVISPSSTA